MVKMTLYEWQNTSKDISGLIVQASKIDGSDGWQPFPIGMQYSYAYNFHKGYSIQFGPHNQAVLAAFNPTTDQHRRRYEKNRSDIMINLQKNGISNVKMNPEHYFDSLPHYKFVMSPEGNSIDCHRHYEAIIAGCIPVIEHNPLIEEKYKGCPILYTNDYSEITETYLLEKYESMLHKIYDFSSLFLKYYDETIQNEIKMCGNFWMKETTGKIWYV